MKASTISTCAAYKKTILHSQKRTRSFKTREELHAHLDKEEKIAKNKIIKSGKARYFYNKALKGADHDKQTKIEKLSTKEALAIVADYIVSTTQVRQFMVSEMQSDTEITLDGIDLNKIVYTSNLIDRLADAGSKKASDARRRKGNGMGFWGQLFGR